MALLEVLVASTDTQLTTTEAVKRVLGTTHVTTDDTYLNELITRASVWAESYVGYPITAQKYRECVAGYGDRRLMVARTPVRAIPSVWDATDTGTATTILSTDYRLDPDAGFLDRSAGWAWEPLAVPSRFGIPLTSTPWAGQEDAPWLIDYMAGWTRGGIDTGSSLWSTAKGTTSTSRTLPYDIEQAVIRKVVSWYEQDEGLLSKSVGDLTVTYDVIADDPAAKLLTPYRRSA